MSSNRFSSNSLKIQLAKLDMATTATDFPHFVFYFVVRDYGVTLPTGSHLLLTCTNSAVLVTIDCANYALLLARLFLPATASATLVHNFFTSMFDDCMLASRLPD